MNNEEKILELLTGLTSTVAKLTEDVADLKATQAEQGKALTQLQATQAEMQETLTRVAVTQEITVLPQLNTLADGHTHLVKTLATKKQVSEIKELVEDKVVVLESVVKSHSARLAALEKAQ